MTVKSYLPASIFAILYLPSKSVVAPDLTFPFCNMATFTKGSGSPLLSTTFPLTLAPEAPCADAEKATNKEAMNDKVTFFNI